MGEEKGAYIEGCPRDWEKLPQPDLPLVLGMDGGYVRSYDQKSSNQGNFEVIVGKSIKADGTSKQFGGVYCYDTKPHRLGLWNQQLIKSLVSGLCKNSTLSWTPKGVHLLLQVRMLVLNEELGSKFQEWYPGFRVAS